MRCSRSIAANSRPRFMRGSSRRFAAHSLRAQTAQANQIRGLLAKYGIVIPQGISPIARRLPQILEDGGNGLPGAFRHLPDRLGDHLKELDRQVDELEVQLRRWHRENEASKRWAQIPGTGPITAGALVVSIGEAKSFANARQLLAWMRSFKALRRPSVCRVCTRATMPSKWLRTRRATSFMGSTLERMTLVHHWARMAKTTLFSRRLRLARSCSR